MSTPAKPWVLLVGHADWPEFRGARAEMEDLAEVVSVPDVKGVVERLRGGWPPVELVVVAQRYPGEFSGEAIDRLRRVAPLAPIVALLGSWCEGEGRSGRPWPGVVRVYWHQWPAQCRRELERIRLGRSASWTLPATATEEERVLATSGRAVIDRDGLILLATWRREAYDWLALGLRQRGHATAWLRPGEPIYVEGAAGAALDATELTSDEARELGRLVQAVAPGPVVVLLDFPRIEDRARALSAGATTVLGKPLAIQDLAFCLR